MIDLILAILRFYRNHIIILLAAPNKYTAILHSVRRVGGSRNRSHVGVIQTFPSSTLTCPTLYTLISPLSIPSFLSSTITMAAVRQLPSSQPLLCLM